MLSQSLELHEQSLLLRSMSARDMVLGGHLFPAHQPAFNEADETCSVCFGSLEDPVQTPCQHLFCKECIMNILSIRLVFEIAA